MSQPLPLDAFFASPDPSAARVPHLITAFDAELLNALVRINGAKPGVWNAAPPYDENDLYQPFREDLPFESWSLAYNQGELLELSGYSNTLVFGNDTMIVDSSADKEALKNAEQSKGEGGYHDLPDFAELLSRIGWALMTVGPERQYGLLVVHESKRSYLEMLQSWCLDRGRNTYSLSRSDAGLSLRMRQAPPDARASAIQQHGLQFVAKMSLFGIDPQEIRQSFDEMMKHIIESQKQN
ncbi:MAG TPA: hypothetical protein VEK08_20875 [Planctomycetota bacterium]|nr:hypothetical protein [Planctomycetota bacterium]